MVIKFEIQIKVKLIFFKNYITKVNPKLYKQLKIVNQT